MSKSAKDISPGGGKYGNAATPTQEPHGAVILADIDADLLRDTLAEVLVSGDAMLWGTTRDGGAVVIQMFSGDASDKLYASTAGELEDKLRAVREVAAAQ